jgi:regulator of sigma E protease
MSYLLIVGVLGLIILVHEAGHLLAAKWVGIPIARFSVGFGPRLWSFLAGGTEYRLSAVPCGGYVLPGISDLKEFERLPLGKRVFFALGGPLANFLAAFVCLSAIHVAGHGLSFAALVIDPLLETWQTTVAMVASIPILFSNPGQLSGLVGIVAIGHQQVGSSAIRLLQFSMFLNVNLAVLNLLPILPLDGGRIVMGTLQRLFPPVRRLELPLTLAGWVALMGLMGYATFQDISRLVWAAVA